MRKSALGLISLAAPAIIGALATTACENPVDNPLTDGAESLCGPCGTLATGDIGISGNARLDGFFQAVSTISTATASIDADFVANVDALILTFGVDVAADADIGVKVDELIAKIEADITANAEGGVTLNYTPPKCSANVNVAVEAQAHCEAKANCEVDVQPGSVAVTCEGTCEGSCDAECEGELKCDLHASATCEGQCEGTCELETAAACNGTCRGSCSGTCTAQDSEGNCAGECDGDCTGSCELKAAAQCSGSCTGKCVVAAGVMCDGEPPKCSGQCTGHCEGSCTGKVTPPSASASCDATAECEAQASAQASASLECTPPSLELAFTLSASATASAEFTAHMAELKVRGAAILHGFAKYNVLLTGKLSGEANAEVLIDPPPIVQIQNEVEVFVNASADILGDIPPGRLPCVVPAFGEAAAKLGGIVSASTSSLAAQAKFAGAITGGFSS